MKSERALNTYPWIFVALALSLSILGWYSLDPAEKSRALLFPAISTLLLAFIRMALALEEAEEGKVHLHLAHTDELTQVGNRRELLARLHALPRDGSHSLLLLDLDHFKEVNDRWGRGAGDSVLKEIAHRFRAALPSDSYLARLGGDEFGAIVEGGQERAAEIASRLHTSLATPIYIGEQALTLEVSVGIAPIQTSSDPLEFADRQMYLAKRSAR